MLAVDHAHQVLNRFHHFREIVQRNQEQQDTGEGETHAPELRQQEYEEAYPEAQFIVIQVTEFKSIVESQRLSLAPY